MLNLKRVGRSLLFVQLELIVSKSIELEVLNKMNYEISDLTTKQEGKPNGSSQRLGATLRILIDQSCESAALELFYVGC